MADPDPYSKQLAGFAVSRLGETLAAIIAGPGAIGALDRWADPNDPAEPGAEHVERLRQFRRIWDLFGDGVVDEHMARSWFISGGVIEDSIPAIEIREGRFERLWPFAQRFAREGTNGY